MNVRATAELPAEFTASFPLGLVSRQSDRRESEKHVLIAVSQIPALEKGSFKLTESAAIATVSLDWFDRELESEG